jgi:uncharacterized protein YebE (UPF0316 family)
MFVFNNEIMNYVLLPLIIMLARIADVSMSTMRIISLSKGYKLMATLLGFFEALIWSIAISRLISAGNNWISYIAFALGFASGVYIGMKIEEKLALGYLVVRVIVNKNEISLKENLKTSNFGFTTVDAQGSQGKVTILFIVIKRKNLKLVTNIIENSTPKAFYSVEDIRTTSRGIFPQALGQLK